MLVEILKIIKNKNPHDIKEKIKSLLDEVTVYGDTCLHAALLYNQLDIMKTIIMILRLHPEFKSIINFENNFGKVSFYI